MKRVTRPCADPDSRPNLAAAADLFSDRSFDGATTREIAARAGVTQVERMKPLRVFKGCPYAPGSRGRAPRTTSQSRTQAPHPARGADGPPSEGRTHRPSVRRHPRGADAQGPVRKSRRNPVLSSSVVDAQ
jgi:Bacterial regulatory proteins, tetR family